MKILEKLKQGGSAEIILFEDNKTEVKSFLGDNYISTLITEREVTKSQVPLMAIVFKDHLGKSVTCFEGNYIVKTKIPDPGIYILYKKEFEELQKFLEDEGTFIYTYNPN
jgi:hypothetical protein